MKHCLIALILLLPLSASAAKSGKEVYTTTCIACHGPDGKGLIPGAANFTLANGALSKSDAVLMKHIIDGYQSPKSPMAMPARGANPTLSDEELKNALHYIRETFAPKK